MRKRCGKKHIVPQRKGTEAPISEGLFKATRDSPSIQSVSELFDLARSVEDGRTSKGDARASLKQALMHQSQIVRWSSVHMLGKIGLEALPELRCALGNDNDMVRSMAAAMVYALMRNDRPRPFHPNSIIIGLMNDLINCLESQDRSLVGYSASALSEIAKRDPVSALLVLPKRIPRESWLVGNRLMIIEKVAEAALEIEQGKLR